MACRLHHARDIARHAAASANDVTLLQLRNALGGSISHKHHGVAIKARVVLIVVHRHARRRRRPCWCRTRARHRHGSRHDGGLRRRKSAEDVVRFIPKPLKQSAAIQLDTRVLEVVALLKLVGTSQRRKVVHTPLLEPILAGKCSRNLALKVAQDPLGPRMRDNVAGRLLDLTNEVGNGSLCSLHLSRLHELHTIQDSLDKAQPEVVDLGLSLAIWSGHHGRNLRSLASETSKLVHQSRGHRLRH
mmetsp:Transcript_71957/g.192159  ORF Transcript_71957/g.192159 Transcript_71957/m.192159 type:complete len:245 (-) Transcript_71957:1243-1977(-)